MGKKIVDLNKTINQLDKVDTSSRLAAYLEAAKAAEAFLRAELTDPNGRLYLRWHNGERDVPGQLDDYAVYGLALLELFRSTLSVDYLEQAAFRADQLLQLFSDDAHGGCYRTAVDAETLISRPKELFDGAMPSGNSCAAMLLQSLSELTGEKRWTEAAADQLAFIAGRAERYGAGVAYGLLAMMRALYPHQELLCCSDQFPTELAEYLSKHPASSLAVIWKNSDNAALLAQIAPFTAAYEIPEKGRLWYLCTDGACALPLRHFSDLNLPK